MNGPSFEPEKVVIHPEVDAWEEAAEEGEQPAQVISNGFQTALFGPDLRFSTPEPGT